MSVAETYLPRVAAMAANTTPKVIRRRVDYGAIELQGCDHRTSGSGNPIRLSKTRIHHIALIEHMVGVGISLSKASAASSKFIDQSQPGRPAGKLFEQGLTLLCLRTTGPVVTNPPYHADFSDLSDHGTELFAVDCGKICREVDEALSKTISNRKKQ
jgi:hypothetical protein